MIANLPECGGGSSGRAADKEKTLRPGEVQTSSQQSRTHVIAGNGAAHVEPNPVILKLNFVRNIASSEMIRDFDCEPRSSSHDTVNLRLPRHVPLTLYNSRDPSKSVRVPPVQ